MCRFKLCNLFPLLYILYNVFICSQVSVEKTASGTIESAKTQQKSVEQSVQQSVQKTEQSTRVVQQSVTSSSSVSSSQRKMTSSSVKQSIKIGSSTEIEEIEF